MPLLRFTLSFFITTIFHHKTLHFFLYTLKHSHDSCFKILLCEIEHLNLLGVILHWLYFLLNKGHVFLFLLHLTNSFELFPGHFSQCYIAGTLDSVKFRACVCVCVCVCVFVCTMGWYGCLCVLWAGMCVCEIGRASCRERV